MKIVAAKYDREGSKHREAGDNASAIASFRKAIKHAPTWDVSWYNLGLTYKYMGDWSESYRCNAEAIRLDRKNEAAIWNMGIAATALGNWSEARRAWTLYGIDMPAGDGPPEVNLGSVPIQINPNGEGEVVWARRIDPARAILSSIPLPESGHRHADIVLNDGAPVGYRKSNGQDVPVFNALEVIASSGEGTFEVTITTNVVDDLVAFEHACEAAGCAAEDWSTMRILCRACSEGNPHEHPEPTIAGDHRFAVASYSIELVKRAVASWSSVTSDVRAGAVVELLAPVPRE